MLITASNTDEIIKKFVPKLYQGADKPIRIDGMDPHISFYLSGDVGAGKTHYAWAYYLWRVRTSADIIGEDVHKVVDNVRIVNVPQMMQKIQGLSFLDKDEYIEALQLTPMLIFDDIGAKRQNDYGETVLQDIIEFRYTNKKYTSFTSNLILSELYYDGRIISRIKGIVGNNFGVLTGEDRRLES